MITEDYVSFETAKLLKEKRFDEKCQKVYMHNGQLLWAQIFMEGESFVNNECIDLVAKYNDWTEGDYAFLCPTQSMAMKWLREVHNIHIQIWILEEKGYWFDIEKILNTQYKHKSLYSTGLEDIYFDTYEQAAEAAIKHCLKNLI